jgi:hypothetical protein
MPLLVQLSTFVGAAALFFTAYCLSVQKRRLRGIVLGCAGMLAGAVAAAVYTLHHHLRGIELDLIPHEPAAQWFVAAYGWSFLVTALITALVPSARARLAGRIAP